MTAASRLGISIRAAWWLTFGLLTVSGILLGFYYAPTTGDAWGSVWYIEHHVSMGHFIRGLHGVGASALIMLSVLQLAQAFIRLDHRSPGHLRWIAGVILLGLSLAFCMTGALLPWDQAGFWQSIVETKIMASTPGGDLLSPLLMGGSELGNATLTRYYALHAMVLPLVCVGLWLGVRRLETHLDLDPEPVWSDSAQRLLNLVVFLIVLGVIAALAFAVGAELDAPADPGSNFDARPEWMFLGLYGLRSLFEGPLEFVATVIIPGAVGGFLVTLPWLDRSPRLHRLLAGALVGLLLGAAAFTVKPSMDDAKDGDLQARLKFQRRMGERATQYANAGGGVAADGSITLFEGYKAFYRHHCNGCHSFEDMAEEAKAPVLSDYLSRAWIAGFLKDPSHPDHYGKTKLTYDEDLGSGMPPLPEEALQDLDALTEFVASLSGSDYEPPLNPTLVAKGRAAFEDGDCSNCHELDRSEGTGPALGHHGSREWLINLLKNPSAAEYYGPEFGSGMPRYDHLPSTELEALAEWLIQIRSVPLPSP